MVSTKVHVSGEWSGKRKQLCVDGKTGVVAFKYNLCYTTVCFCTIGSHLHIVHQAPTEMEVPNLRQPCVLWCITSPCSYRTEYQWFTIPDEDLFPDSPVVFVDKPLVYCCKVLAGRSEVTSASMRVRVNPGSLSYDTMYITSYYCSS